MEYIDAIFREAKLRPYTIGKIMALPAPRSQTFEFLGIRKYMFCTRHLKLAKNGILDKINGVLIKMLNGEFTNLLVIT